MGWDEGGTTPISGCVMAKILRFNVTVQSYIPNSGFRMLKPKIN